jgi:hypothetical protein
MNPLIVHKKTGFQNLTPESHVIIRDFRGVLFYSTEGLRPVKAFNLPPGTYFVDKGNIKPLSKPLHYKFARLPLPERNLKPPFNFSVMFANNPNKCSIIWNEKTIIFDTNLKMKSLPELDFILFHEFSHCRYTTEKYADLQATNLMKKRGYNPSQIGSAPITSLSDMQYERKKHIVNNIIRYV